MRWLLVFTFLACDSDERTLRRLKLPLEEATGNPTSTMTRREPRAPITVSSMVADGKHWRRGPRLDPEGLRREARRDDRVRARLLHLRRRRLGRSQPARAVRGGGGQRDVHRLRGAGGTERGRVVDRARAAARRGRGRHRPADAGAPHRRDRPLLGWLSDQLDTVVLLDAAYGEVDKYRAWVLGSEDRRLINIGDDILYIKSSLGHFPLVTGGIALPMILRTLRAPRLLRKPLAEILARP